MLHESSPQISVSELDRRCNGLALFYSQQENLLNPQCRLCQNPNTLLFWRQDTDDSVFFHCKTCDLIFRDPAAHLNSKEEKQRYDLHNNEDTPAYRHFLSCLINPTIPHLRSMMHGLDFGCGPNPLLSKILLEHGFLCENYDPFYFAKTELLQKTYDFIFCSEVVEHFYEPLRDWKILYQLLMPGGWLAVMTQSPPNDFAKWHYHRDPTHVSFYSPLTMKWLAQKFNLNLQSYPKGVWLFKNG